MSQNTPKIEIYMRPGCGFCMRALQFLDMKGLAYQQYDIWDEEGRQQEMRDRSNGGRTVPQIFINDQPIGGCDEMLTMDRNGEFDALVK